MQSSTSLPYLDQGFNSYYCKKNPKKLWQESFK